MDYRDFKITRKARCLNFRRCLYVISPAPSERLQIKAKSFYKIGIAASGLFNRLNCYGTYWPAGTIIHLVCPILQDRYSDKSTIRLVEQYILDLQDDRQRTKSKAESFVKLDLEKIRNDLLRHPAVDMVWMVPAKKKIVFKQF